MHGSAAPDMGDAGYAAIGSETPEEGHGQENAELDAHKVAFSSQEGYGSEDPQRDVPAG